MGLLSIFLRRPPEPPRQSSWYTVPPDPPTTAAPVEPSHSRIADEVPTMHIRDADRLSRIEAHKARFARESIEKKQAEDAAATAAQVLVNYCPTCGQPIKRRKPADGHGGLVDARGDGDRPREAPVRKAAAALATFAKVRDKGESR